MFDKRLLLKQFDMLDTKLPAIGELRSSMIDLMRLALDLL